MSKRRKVGAEGSGVSSVSIYFDGDVGDYIVVYDADKIRGGDPDSAYFTDDRDDAFATARVMAGVPQRKRNPSERRWATSQVTLYHGPTLNAVGAGPWGIVDHRDDKHGTPFVRRFKTLRQAENAAARKADDIGDDVTVWRIAHDGSRESANAYVVVHTVYAHGS